MAKPWTDAEINYLLAAIHGQTAAQIAEHLERSERSVKNKLNSLGVRITDTRKKFLTKRADLLVCSSHRFSYLRNAGKLTSSEIAKKINKTTYAVKEKARRLNVSLQINAWNYKDVNLLEKLVKEGKKLGLKIGEILNRTPNFAEGNILMFLSNLFYTSLIIYTFVYFIVWLAVIINVTKFFFKK